MCVHVRMRVLMWWLCWGQCGCKESGAKGVHKGESGGEGTHAWGALSPSSIAPTLGRRHTAAAASIAVQEGGVHRRLALSLQLNIKPTMLHQSGVY